jgi:hypothetical protein
VKASSAAHLLRVRLDDARAAEDDDRAVVYRMMKGRAREHEPVHERDVDAHVRARAERLLHPARARAVQVEHVADAPVRGRYHDGLAVRDERDVADEALVQMS